jgi:hypothetical protein
MKYSPLRKLMFTLIKQKWNSGNRQFPGGLKKISENK